MMWMSALMLAAAVLVVPGTDRLRRRLRASAEAADTTAGADRATNDAPSTRPDPLAVAGTFDLLAACLKAGLPVPDAVAAVAASAPDPLGESLRRTADRLALGADPATAWDVVASEPATEALARMARRSARSGAALSSAMADLATQQRTEAEDRAIAAVEKAGVLIGGPLGLCFLPAFVCLGIVPVVIGLAGRVLEGGLL
ncbi:type II secretion system F family protein [Prescottella equi]|nr:type II secretion system F family protein [Prescottella equi]MBM4489941.1 type II secretion system F family protein [Prescottella equi]MBM4496758.1 type II secretion system F family protein [Prescottella equi]MBM4501021.1 type II secretion system F family protein [Prescottella equi]MBM4502742.1 type II secretion system F family protein [Prescottella equi]MBM4548284.1 type II secretion system F family protein [Prescottella equi]